MYTSICKRIRIHQRTCLHQEMSTLSQQGCVNIIRNYLSWLKTQSIGRILIALFYNNKAQIVRKMRIFYFTFDVKTIESFNHSSPTKWSHYKPTELSPYLRNLRIPILRIAVWY